MRMSIPKVEICYPHTMRHFAQMLDLKDDGDSIAEYIALHRAVWPEVTDGLRRIGIQKMRIYRGGTRLFMIIETDDGFDPARYQEYASSSKTQQWDALTRTFQQPAPNAKPGEWWSSMDEIFDLASFPATQESATR